MIIGDTIRIIVEFIDWNDEFRDPDEVTLTIYGQIRPQY